MLFQAVIVDDNLAELISSNPSFIELVNILKNTNRYGFRGDAISKCQLGWIHPEDVLLYS